MEEIVTLLIPVTFLAALGLERLFPARPLPKVRFWVLKGFVFFVMTGLMNALLPALVAPHVEGLRVISVEKLGLPAAVVVTLLVSELLAYVVHRTMHRVPFIWRWTHQMHHSAERMDVAGAAYFHPFDISINVLALTAALALLHVGADAAALAGYLGFCFAIFQHLNVRTPRWVGFFVQRPEGHSVHHERGLHAYNYGNIALFDQLFGTYRNPQTFSAVQGFWDGASKRVGAMLIGRDVGEPAAGPVETSPAGWPAIR
jgi:sterol desaturase/sphingolipid hydroxylase (fatty acid hydroxylase superfamily)